LSYYKDREKRTWLWKGKNNGPSMKCKDNSKAEQRIWNFFVLNNVLDPTRIFFPIVWNIVKNCHHLIRNIVSLISNLHKNNSFKAMNRDQIFYFLTYFFVAGFFRSFFLNKKHQSKNRLLTKSPNYKIEEISTK
jgi:hypothetical protein